MLGYILPVLQFFKLHVVDENGILSETNLVAAVTDAVERSYVPGKAVGILSGNDRDIWAKDYELLLGFTLLPFTSLVCCSLLPAESLVNVNTIFRIR